MKRLTADILTLMSQAVSDVTFSRGAARAVRSTATKRTTTTTKTTA
ncbi:hypothetical protein [Roseibium hamelinense]|nr:hypothetical protein [Roseibium hamelinense]